jgi:hypothetical protein
MVRLNKRHLHSTRVWDDCFLVEREKVHPFGIDSEHVYDKFARAFGAVNRPGPP